MAIQKVLIYPDPRLRQAAKPVQDITAEIQTIIDDMFDTMAHYNGAGLAATQIGVFWRIVVTDHSHDPAGKRCLINPEFILQEGEQDHTEGCLSVPGFSDTVKRPLKVKLQYLDREGQSHVIEEEGLLAACFSHEIDHLDGKVYVDYLSRFKQQRIKQRLVKQLKKDAKQEG